MKIFDICNEIAEIEGKLMMGEIEFKYDSLMCAMKPGHPAEILDDILADVFWTAYGGEEPSEESVRDLVKGLKRYRRTFGVKEVTKQINKLEKYLEERQTEEAKE